MSIVLFSASSKQGTLFVSLLTVPFLYIITRFLPQRSKFSVVQFKLPCNIEFLTRLIKR